MNMINPLHQEILQLIKENSGKGTSQTFSDRYLGNTNPRYAITAPVMRQIAREWMRNHKLLEHREFSELIGNLIQGASSTEKLIAGMLLDYSTKNQREFSPLLFDEWLKHLNGWAEIDAVCTGDYTITHILLQWNKWKTLLTNLSKDENINKRRASLVFFCSPLPHHNDERLGVMALRIVDQLKTEKHILITKGISWVLRSMVKNYRKQLEDYLHKKGETLPKIALRETQVKLKTGTKTKRKDVISGN